MSQEQSDKWTERDQPREEMKEYHYWVGHMETSAMLTESMAERLGAKPIGEALDDADKGKNNEANRASTKSREADDAGTYSADDPDGKQALAKARQARNKRSAGS